MTLPLQLQKILLEKLAMKIRMIKIYELCVRAETEINQFSRFFTTIHSPLTAERV